VVDGSRRPRSRCLASQATFDVAIDGKSLLGELVTPVATTTPTAMAAERARTRSKRDHSVTPSIRVEKARPVAVSTFSGAGM
jgi:hypothetical protein